MLRRGRTWSAARRSPCATSSVAWLHCASWRAAPKITATRRRISPAMDGTHSPAAAAAVTNLPEVLDIARIMHAIPHRYPMLMLDRVVDMIRDESAVGVKNV